MHWIVKLNILILIGYFLGAIVSKDAIMIWLIGGLYQVGLLLLFYIVLAVLSIIYKKSDSIIKARGAVANSIAIIVLLGTPACMMTGWVIGTILRT